MPAMTATHRHKAELIVLLGLLSAIGPLSIDTYLPSMPAIAADFGIGSSMVEQSVTAYFFGLAGGLVLAGPLSDRFGRRPLLLVGLWTYLATTIACAFAPTIGLLVACRALQGFGASATTAAGRAVIRDIWSGNLAARAMSFVTMVMTFAPLIAPILGGQIFIHLGWRAIFWVMAGFGTLLLLLIQWRMIETNGPDRRAGTSIAVFFRAYGRILRSLRAWVYLLAGGLSFAAMFAYITGSPFVYMEVYGVSPAHFGYFYGLNVLSLLLGNWLNSRHVVRLGYQRLLVLGAAVSALGTLAFWLAAFTTTGGFTIVVLTLLVAVGPVSMTGANAIAGLLDLFPANAGAASSLFGVAQYGLGALGGALVGLFYNGTATALALAMLLLAGGGLAASLLVNSIARGSGGATAADAEPAVAQG